ncbi:hypothetical protein [Anoxynatronum buryatiense]|uniref:Uncharacterized protein n=1 Tax=Anoxynatronum buryatiense TaxID=489973 RepID=A0AA45WX06_9CLOT|nr:hypothetical protein [Anoxynatronum buryatiense]SMP61848.1 hypothetical protein SAMN06296020_109106 [Anoxynatronum buryatiense]
MAHVESNHDAVKWHQINLTTSATDAELNQVLEYYTNWEPENFQWFCLARDLKRLTGALFLVLSEYSPAKMSLVTRGIEGIPQKVEAVIHQLGHPMIGHEWILAEGVYEELQNGRLLRLDSIHEASSYHIPEFIGFTIEKMLGIGNIYSMSFLHNGQLMGNFVLAMPKGQELASERQVVLFSQGVGRVLANAGVDRSNES